MKQPKCYKDGNTVLWVCKSVDKYLVRRLYLNTGKSTWARIKIPWSFKKDEVDQALDDFAAERKLKLWDGVNSQLPEEVDE